MGSRDIKGQWGVFTCRLPIAYCLTLQIEFPRRCGFFHQAFTSRAQRYSKVARA